MYLVKNGKRPTEKLTTKQDPVFYVTPEYKEKGKRQALGHRKNRASPPSTNYGLPLYLQDLPSVELSKTFSSDSQEVQKKQQLPSRYLPPATSYGVPITTQEQPAIYNESNSIDESNESESVERHGYEYSQPKDQIIVNKNIYYYKAPTEFEIQPTIQTVKLPKPQKNYKIIFIKAPSVPAPSSVIQVAPQNEEKTLVYVLVKKPDEQSELVVPSPAPTQPSKPEVYFVKYSAKRERVETSEKTYGVPQYGKGYYYGPGNGENDDGSKTEETANNEYITLPQSDQEDYQSSQKESLKKKRGFVRGVRSSSFSSDATRNDLQHFVNDFSKLEQRRTVYE